MRYAREADELGARVAALVGEGQAEQAQSLLAPTLQQRTPFRLLDRVGRALGTGPERIEGWSLWLHPFLDRVVAEGTMGGWVVAGSALGAQLDHDLPGALARCRAYVVAGDAWYVADILGERIPGPALVAEFDAALGTLAPWREDANRWVRRAVGVAAHFWAKRSRGAPDLLPQAERLLAFLSPMFEEWEMDAAKGVGWGLKTLGKHYPDLVAGWLVEQVVRCERHPRAVTLRKAITYLPDEQRARLETA